MFMYEHQKLWCLKGGSSLIGAHRVLTTRKSPTVKNTRYIGIITVIATPITLAVLGGLLGGKVRQAYFFLKATKALCTL